MSISAADGSWAVAIHGGAGGFDPAAIPAPEARRLHESLAAAVGAGAAILEGGGSAIDAVQEAVRLLEDDPAFNAGRGAVLTSAGTHELDAAVMDGPGRRAGAVAGARTVRNPVLAARMVMERSPHVLLVGNGAEAFALAQGLDRVEPSWFTTPHAEAALARWRAERASATAAGRHGTVGAVARDRQGRLAAATSTGGMTGKLPGRVGDSPLIGAGTWADAGCAVSATGHGELFIRHAAARTIAARLELAGDALQAAADAVVRGELRRAGGEGAVIALGLAGDPVFSSNVPGFLHAWRRSGGSAATRLGTEATPASRPAER